MDEYRVHDGCMDIDLGGWVHGVDGYTYMGVHGCMDAWVCG